MLNEVHSSRAPNGTQMPGIDAPRCVAVWVGTALAAAYAIAELNPAWIAGLLAAALLMVPLRTSPHRLLRPTRGRTRVLLIGRSPIARKLMDAMAACPHAGYSVVGVIDENLPHQTAAFPIVGPLGDLRSIIARVRPNRIIIGLTDRRGRLPLFDLLESRVRGVAVEDAAEAYERLTGKLAIESLTPGCLIASHGFRNSRVIAVCQRALSFTVALSGLVLLAPLVAAISVAIKLDSRGAILFAQDRVGMAGRPFRLLKFRTMHPTSHPTSEWAADNLDRITRVGRCLRKIRLDELPQLINILRGDMNLVGPRPHPVSNFQLFLRNIPYYGLRASVRPGLTGWAQVRYRYANNLEEETEKMRYDLYYLKHLSLSLDFRILAQTLLIVLSGREPAPGQMQRPEASPPPAGHPASGVALSCYPMARAAGHPAIHPSAAAALGTPVRHPSAAAALGTPVRWSARLARHHRPSPTDHQALEQDSWCPESEIR